jgi:transglutaminase-like putative cysteine protease
MTEPERRLDLAPYLAPTRYLDFEHPTVARFVAETTAGASDDRERAVRLFHAVRDEVRYDPYRVDLSPEGFFASTTLDRRAAFCVPKAILLAASLRAVGIPARLGFADVRNHLATQRLLELLGTNLFVYHGYTEVHLGGRWIKATPTFNRSLCERFGVATLDFDGETDAILQPFDREGRQHMEYVEDRGHFADFPLDDMIAAWRKLYPAWFSLARATDGDFEREAQAERGR